MRDTRHNPSASHHDWDKAFYYCQVNWDLKVLTEAINDSLIQLVFGDEYRRDRIALTTALVTAYTHPKIDGDENVVRACLAAARERHGDSWTPTDFEAVAHSFITTLPAGSAQLAREYQQYVTLPENDALYIFKREM